MKQLKNIIQNIKLNGFDNIYALGLNLKDGRIISCKVYNKIYKYDKKYENFLREFGGEKCIEYFSTTNEWMNYYPGFSGFTLGVEIDLKNDDLNHRCGFGFKDKKQGELSFNAFYLNSEKEIVEKEKYKYIYAIDRKDIKNYLEVKWYEVKCGEENNYSFCPKITYNLFPKIEFCILEFLNPLNKNIFNCIKDYDEDFYILNCGENSQSQKIYLIHNENKNINKLIKLLVGLKKFMNPCLTDF